MAMSDEEMGTCLRKALGDLVELNCSRALVGTASETLSSVRDPVQLVHVE